MCAITAAYDLDVSANASIRTIPSNMVCLEILNRFYGSEILSLFNVFIWPFPLERTFDTSSKRFTK